jgi:hypothetical protein
VPPRSPASTRRLPSRGGSGDCAGRLLVGLTVTADSVERALLLAPPDDELDTDNNDGGLTEARRELARGEGLTTEELERELDLR